MWPLPQTFVACRKLWARRSSGFGMRRGINAELPLHTGTMKKLMPFLFVAGVLVLSPMSIRASDRYPSSATKAMDSEKYLLGQKIFTGKLKLGDVDHRLAATQQPLLKKMQSQLPKTAQESAKLPSMAGKLSTTQLAALEYYLQMRYRVK